MSKFLLEVFCEEIPAKMQLDCSQIFKNILCEALNIKSEVVHCCSPRHFAFTIDDFNLKTKIEIKGPKTNAPENAIQGFMNKYGIHNKNDFLEKDGVFFLERSLSYEEAITELSHSISSAMHKMVWPKSMSWGNNSIRWIRPIHAITCMLDDKIIPVELGHIKSNNITYGHRSQGSNAIEIKSADASQYIQLLKQNGVIVSQDERKESILDQISLITKPLGLNLIYDDELLNEVVGLVENPFVLLGKIDQQFMSLPKEVLITSLKSHQKYLLLNKGNELAPFFIIVSDIKPDDAGATIVEGNEKVLRARLSDAQHFIKTDLKTSLESFSEKLHKIQFHKDIGSVYEKVLRIKSIAGEICKQLNIPSDNSERAAQLCKNDLVSQMVGEFPELQGIIGYYYAIAQGETNEVALAIRDHYKPSGPNDSLPETLIGCIVAIADKLDTLQSLFSIGIKPTSTKDPYALRRAAIGILRMISSRKELMQNLNIKKLDINNDVVEFMQERGRQMFKDSQFDEVCNALERNN
jgi:glycyl-tRNA synthetase beta chain